MRAFLLFLLLFTYSLQVDFVVGSLSSSRISMVSGGTNNKIYFAGGFPVSDAVDIYDLVTKQWTTSTLSKGRFWISATPVGNLMMFGGGVDSANTYGNYAEIFDTANGQRTITTLPVSTCAGAATSVRDIALFARGIISDPNDGTIVDVFNSTFRQWSTTQYSLARRDMTAVSNGDYAFFAGGRLSTLEVVSNVDIFYVGNKTWTLTYLSAPRSHLSSTRLKDLVIFAGGTTNISDIQDSAVVDLFNVTTKRWLPTAQLSQARRWLSASSVGNLAIFGGGTYSIPAFGSDVVDIFNLTSNIWSSSRLTIPMPEAASVSLGGTIFFGGRGIVNMYTPPVANVTVPTTAISTATEAQLTAPEQQQNGPTTLQWIAYIVPAAAGILIIAVVILVVLLFRKKRKNHFGGEKLRKDTLDRAEMAVYSSAPTVLIGTHAYSPMPMTVKEIADAKQIVLQTQIGKGSGGVVYKADWKGVSVAVKQLSGEEITPQWLHIFQQECDLMKSMEPHPNVIRFFGIVKEPLSIVTEYCPNGSLESYLADKSVVISMKQSISFLKSIAMGMGHLAQQKIVHRDLASRNVLLKRDFTAVVSDFGMSRVHNDGNAYFATAENNQWPIKWMAPETFTNQFFSEKTDVFSFGVVCVEVLTRREPYPEIPTGQFWLHVLPQDLISTLPNYIPEGAPDFLFTLVRQCISKDPILRPNFRTICKVFDGE